MVVVSRMDVEDPGLTDLVYACRIGMDGTLPVVVQQALDDTQLSDAARLLMWHLSRRLDLWEYRETKVFSLSRDLGRHENTVSGALRQLVSRGYLVEHEKRKPRAYRLPLSRRTGESR